MKRMVCIAVLSVLSFTYGLCASRGDSLSVVFWNVENFFDYVDGGTGESDKEFSSIGSRHWTKKRFYAKCDAVAKSILWMGDKYGRMPDLIGLAEIENKGVLSKLLRSTALRKYDYEIVHHDSGDRRGIDVAILYRRSSMTLESISVKVPEYEGFRLATRDILHARMCLADSCRLDFIVNHHPSKYGGEKVSGQKRMAAMRALKNLTDSLNHAGPAPRTVIAMGDFNDTPDSEPFGLMEGILVNKGVPLHEKGLGTIRYEGKWDLIDMFLVSPEIAPDTGMEILKVPFLMVRDTKHPGEKPLRTYSGPKHLGGVSDHCPIILKFR